MSAGLSEPVTPEAWEQVLAAEFTAFMEETRAAMNAAREGHWIADTEEVVRDAGERLRQRALEKLLQLRVQAGEGASSPAGSRRAGMGHVRVRRRMWWQKGVGIQAPGLDEITRQRQQTRAAAKREALRRLRAYVGERVAMMDYPACRANPGAPGLGHWERPDRSAVQDDDRTAEGFGHALGRAERRGHVGPQRLGGFRRVVRILARPRCPVELVTPVTAAHSGGVIRTRRASPPRRTAWPGRSLALRVLIPIAESCPVTQCFAVGNRPSASPSVRRATG